MVETHVRLSEDQLNKLRQQAAEQGTTVSELIRRAVDRWMQLSSKDPSAEQRSRALAAAGRFASGVGDVARRHDDYLSEALGT